MHKLMARPPAKNSKVIAGVATSIFCLGRGDADGSTGDAGAFDFGIQEASTDSDAAILGEGWGGK